MSCATFMDKYSCCCVKSYSHSPIVDPLEEDQLSVVMCPAMTQKVGTRWLKYIQYPDLYHLVAHPIILLCYISGMKCIII